MHMQHAEGTTTAVDGQHSVPVWGLTKYYVCTMYMQYVYKNVLHAKSRGLNRARPEPSREWRLWLGPALEKAGAGLGLAKAGASGPSRAGTSLPMGDSASTHTLTRIKPIPGLMGVGVAGYGCGYHENPWDPWVPQVLMNCNMKTSSN